MMVLRPKDRELRVREIRVTLLDATRSPTPTGALLKLKEAAGQLTNLIRLETGTPGGVVPLEGGTADATQADQGYPETADAPG